MRPPACQVWRSTGMYAPPGEVVTVTIGNAAAVASGKLGLLIGCHDDTLWGKDEPLRRPPRQAYQAVTPGALVNHSDRNSQCPHGSNPLTVPG